MHAFNTLYNIYMYISILCYASIDSLYYEMLMASM